MLVGPADVEGLPFGTVAFSAGGRQAWLRRGGGCTRRCHGRSVRPGQTLGTHSPIRAVHSCSARARARSAAHALVRAARITARRCPRRGCRASGSWGRRTARSMGSTTSRSNDTRSEQRRLLAGGHAGVDGARSITGPHESTDGRTRRPAIGDSLVVACPPEARFGACFGACAPLAPSSLPSSSSPPFANPWRTGREQRPRRPRTVPQVPSFSPACRQPPRSVEIRRVLVQAEGPRVGSVPSA